MFENTRVELDSKVPDSGPVTGDALLDDAQQRHSRSDLWQDLYKHAQGLHARNAELAGQIKHAYNALRAARTDEEVGALGDLIKDLSVEKNVIGAQMSDICMQSRLQVVENERR